MSKLVGYKEGNMLQDIRKNIKMIKKYFLLMKRRSRRANTKISTLS